MNQREIVSALKYISRIKHSFMLSELRDKVKGTVTTREIYAVIGPQLYDLGLRAVPEGEDYRIEKLPAPVKLSLSREEQERMDVFFQAPRVSRRLERLVRQYIETKAKKPIDDPGLLDGIREAIRVQKEQYWKEGKARKIDYHSSYSALGYLGYQFPVYFIQFEHVLYDLIQDGLLKDRMKVLDVGTGPGVVSLAIIDFYNRLDHGEAAVYALEKYPENIEAYNALVPEYATHKGRVQVERPLKADLMARDIIGVPDKLDLVVFSNVLNEINAPFNDRADAVSRLASHLSPEGSIVIIEPADRENSTKMRKLVMRLTELG
ncbi:MAG TPA: class I SAM-dependent methyltransferase, partial [Methanocella sp.]|nr:class I SAM-dependent methyltransferase [Methanocella sp.]